MVELQSKLENVPDNDTFDDSWGQSLSQNELENGLGLTGLTMQLFRKSDDKLLAERREHAAHFWVTSFTTIEGRDDYTIKDRVYTVNHFNFKNKECANYFNEGIRKSINLARIYRWNNAELITSDHAIDTNVLIIYGK